MLEHTAVCFFSSRRRHTRFDCDWSSDVCSSDLWVPSDNGIVLKILSVDGSGKARLDLDGDGDEDRSEERRVGKECRSRRAADHSKKYNRGLRWLDND